MHSSTVSKEGDQLSLSPLLCGTTSWSQAVFDCTRVLMRTGSLNRVVPRTLGSPLVSHNRVQQRSYYHLSSYLRPPTLTSCCLMDSPSPRVKYPKNSVVDTALLPPYLPSRNSPANFPFQVLRAVLADRPGM